MAKWFWMEPASTKEQRVDPYQVLRDHVGYVAAVRAEVRMLRREVHAFNIQMKEFIDMKFSELQGNVEKLIDAAIANKNAVATIVATAPDDPAVEALNSKVLVALDVLSAAHDASAPPAVSPVTGTVPPAPDPATLPPTTAPAAPADATPPAPPPVDPNAPVQ
jgi:hypothetical protein